MTQSSKYVLFWCLLAIVCPAYPQFVGSGSKGSDGALELTIPGEVVFDPGLFKPPLNPAGDNVYHFTSIYIATGVTVKLPAKVLHGPVFWLAQGPVRIDGNIDLHGEDGGAASARFPNSAGAGGYAGGIQRKPGYGPGAGELSGVFTGNQFLVPLVGGSGGAGGEDCGGGAGGGALLISSSSSITVNGTISANGGNAGATCRAGGGSGGAIRLVAPLIDGSGFLSAKGGQPDGGDGRVRLEAFTNYFTGNLNETPASTGKPFGLFLPPSPPASVRVVSVDGIPIAAYRVDSSRIPKILLNRLNRSVPVTIGIEAKFIPPGTVVELEFFSEDGTGQLVSATPLAGTLERSTATVSVALVNGASVGYVRANWKQP